MEYTLFFLAVLPGLLLIRYVYKLDSVEKEPLGLLIKLVIYGAIATIPAIIIGLSANEVMLEIFDEDDILYLIIDNFIVTALVEEFVKYKALRAASWKHNAFDYMFDGIVYAVCASMGFAILENIAYIMEDGSYELVIMRAVLSVPGHCIFGIFMGYFYGRAKASANKGNFTIFSRMMAVLVPTIFHGWYDFLLSFEADEIMIIFGGFVIFMDVIAYTLLKRIARKDRKITVA